jgi:crossover junction endodeoxyribonuclease RuvC
MRIVGLDPSTKTGFVALGEDGQVLKAKELMGIGKEDPVRMITLIDEVVKHVEKDDFIIIEGFGFASQQAIQSGGIGWGMRMALVRRGYKYIEVAPNALKKFVNVTGWKGETGNKQRLQGAEKKHAVMNAVNEHFGFTHSSDNVVDAYVLAQIGKSIKNRKVDFQYQKEVVETVMNSSKK